MKDFDHKLRPLVPGNPEARKWMEEASKTIDRLLKEVERLDSPFRKAHKQAEEELKGFGMAAENVILKRKVDALQAELDALMLEYCPDEMSVDQIQEWIDNQVSCTDEQLSVLATTVDGNK